MPAAPIAAVALWWAYPPTPPDLGDAVAIGPPPALTSDRPEVPENGPVRTDIPEKGADIATPTVNPESKPQNAQQLIDSAKQALERGDVVAARSHFSDAIRAGVEEPEASVVRGELTRLGAETVFSARVFEGDPFVERYIIKSGDSLAKIASAHKVSADLLAEINGIRDKNLIRAGQTIKIIRGPFHAVVDKSDFSLDVYLSNTFVKHYRVGLGADGSTPTGTWKVGTKLVNPTYYPARGGAIVAADDPENPLGERWIGLVGVDGEAKGQERYGIHGTNEPDSIGQNVSLGCVRMYNEDVEQLYHYLVEKHSTVTIKD